MELKGKNVLITGGGSGYGKGLAAELVRRGAKVWISGRTAGRLEAAAGETGACPIVADVTSGADWDRVFDEIGDLDVLVNNAGAGVRIAPLSAQSDEDIVAAVNVNLTGAIMGSARAARLMSERKSGTIVNVSSVCARHAWPNWSVYTAAKAGLANFSKALHAELRPHGVRVFCLMPSWGSTDFNKTAGLTGVADDPSLAGECIQPEDFGHWVADLLELPDRLTVPEVTLQPMIQEIVPM